MFSGDTVALVTPDFKASEQLEAVTILIILFVMR